MQLTQGKKGVVPSAESKSNRSRVRISTVGPGVSTGLAHLIQKPKI